MCRQFRDYSLVLVRFLWNVPPIGRLGLKRSRGEKEEAILDEPIRQVSLNRAARKRAGDSP